MLLFSMLMDRRTRHSKKKKEYSYYCIKNDANNHFCISILFL